MRLITGIFLLAAAFTIYLYVDFKAPSGLVQETSVIIPRGKGFGGSVQALAQAGVISHPLLFKAITVATGDARRIKAGEYLFPANVSPQEVAALLVSGKVVVHKITLAEGLNVREVRALLQNEKVLEGDIPAVIPEGSLLPETYYFTYGDKRAEVVARMQEGAKKLLAESWEKRDPQTLLSSPQQALILASIVEKETGLPQERPHVASVFINRLRKGMKLQSDPTTAYGIEQKTGTALGRALTGNDLDTPTPYNTYTIDALPPAPIANPGKASLEAVLHPAQTDDLYFVATGNGGHNFAASLEQHNRNVAAYRAAIRK